MSRRRFPAVFLRIPSPFLMLNDPQFTDVLGFACCNCFLQIPPDSLWPSSQVTAMAILEYSRNKALVYFVAFLVLLCPSGNSSDTRASASSQTEHLIESLLPSTSVSQEATELQIIMFPFQCVPHSFWIHWSKRFQFCFIAPQNRIPKPLCLISVVLSLLEPTFVVVLVQSWCMSSASA